LSKITVDLLPALGSLIYIKPRSISLAYRLSAFFTVKISKNGYECIKSNSSVIFSEFLLVSVLLKRLAVASLFGAVTWQKQFL